MDVSGTKGTLTLDLFGQIIKIQDLDQAPSADDRTLSLPERGATIKVYGEPVQQVISDFLHCIEKQLAALGDASPDEDRLWIEQIDKGRDAYPDILCGTGEDLQSQCIACIGRLGDHLRRNT